MYFEYKKKIYGYECDIYGHLNNANYLQVFECARSDALIDMNFPIQKFIDQNVQLFVARVEIDYKAGIQLEDTITVRSYMSEANRLGSVWQQKIYNSDGQLCSQAVIRIVHARNNKPFRIDHELADYFKSFTEE